MTATEFVEKVSGKLKMPVKRTYEEMLGKDMKLTGYTEVKGEPIKDDVVYRIPVPVVVNVDHKKNLRTQFLRHGKQGVRNYMKKFMKEADVEKAIQFLEA
jgi:hypothetical protein